MGGRLILLAIINGSLLNLMFSQKKDTIKKVEVITLEISDQLRVHCSCGFAERLMITSGVFTCFKTGSVHFRAYAHGTANVTAAVIIQHIQGWVYEGAVLTVDLLQLRVDKMCTVAMSSITYNNDGCESSTDTVSPDDGQDKYTRINGDFGNLDPFSEHSSLNHCDCSGCYLRIKEILSYKK